MRRDVVVVADANVLIDLSARELFDDLGLEFIVPAIAMIECTSVLHAMGVRESSLAYMQVLHGRIDAAGVEIVYERDGEEVWNIASTLGWQKTYDAEYLQLARHRQCGLATYDARLRAAAGRLGIALVEIP